MIVDLEFMTLKSRKLRKKDDNAGGTDELDICGPAVIGLSDVETSYSPITLSLVAMTLVCLTP